jgi:Alpha/beta hydrolase family
MSTFVLVHGAWHGGWCWRFVAPALRKLRHDVHTLSLTGLGDRRHLARPEINLNLHVQDVVALLEMEDLHQIVLVGHSYGGMVITGSLTNARSAFGSWFISMRSFQKTGSALSTISCRSALRHFAQTEKRMGRSLLRLFLCGESHVQITLISKSRAKPDSHSRRSLSPFGLRTKKPSTDCPKPTSIVRHQRQAALTASPQSIASTRRGASLSLRPVTTR